jgi:signal transduction histidine kinase
MQDDERRRIARELHDSVGQLLAAVSINSASVEAEAAKLSPVAARALSENAGLVGEINKEIRTISHLLHPPLLDEAGLTSALSWYIRGFSERSNIKVAVDIPPDFFRPPEEMEIAIFRIVQESLTNIHRHSGSMQASVRLAHIGDRVVVEIKDSGKGMSSRPEMRARREGVGIRGMRERIRQLGGVLEIRSDSSGTTVEVTLPVSGGVST